MPLPVPWILMSPQNTTVKHNDSRGLAAVVVHRSGAFTADRPIDEELQGCRRPSFIISCSPRLSMSGDFVYSYRLGKEGLPAGISVALETWDDRHLVLLEL